jgi:AcrR family transcriptional regulator
MNKDSSTRQVKNGVPRTDLAHATEMRQRIMDGAHRAFQAGGYHGTSVPAIAAESDVSVGLIYRYFASKEELFLTVCKAQTDQHMSELAAVLARIDDPLERLRAAIDRFIDSLLDERWGSIVLAAWAETDRNPRVRDLLLRICDQDRGFAAMFVRDAIARGEAPPDTDVEAVSLAAALLLHGTIAHQAEHGARFDADAARRALVTLLGAVLRPVSSRTT